MTLNNPSIIHVPDTLDNCITGIITGRDYGRGKPYTIYATVFPPHGSMLDVAHRVTLTDGQPWHLADRCTNLGRLVGERADVAPGGRVGE